MNDRPAVRRADVPTRVLLLEDDVDHRELFTLQLGSFAKRTDVVGAAGTLADAIGFLHERADEVDCIVADLGLPDANGMQVLEGLVEVAPGKPIVVLTSRLEQGIEALEAGAQDYLVKGQTDSAFLERAIGHAIARQSLANELVATTRDAEHLVYSVSHDLRGPLSVAGGFVGLLEELSLPPEAMALINPIHRSLARIEAITDDLLEYARSVHGPLRLVQVDLSLLVKAVVQDQLVGQKVHVREPLPTLVGDPRLLRHVIENLVGNAVKYADGSRPAQVEVHAHPHPMGWQINVDDNGIGIPSGSTERVFDMFVRAVEDDVVTGTGIGLAVCRRAIERHQGRIWAEPNPSGVGTRMAFVLPGNLVEGASDAKVVADV